MNLVDTWTVLIIKFLWLFHRILWHLEILWSLPFYRPQYWRPKFVTSWTRWAEVSHTLNSIFLLLCSEVYEAADNLISSAALLLLHFCYHHMRHLFVNILQVIPYMDPYQISLARHLPQIYHSLSQLPSQHITSLQPNITTNSIHAWYHMSFHTGDLPYWGACSHISATSTVIVNVSRVYDTHWDTGISVNEPRLFHATHRYWTDRYLSAPVVVY